MANKIAYGIDLAGFSTGKSGLAKAELVEPNKIAVTVFTDHLFAKSRRGFAKVEDVVDAEAGLLTQLLEEGKVLIDMPLDLQELGNHEQAKMLWQLTKRPVDYVFSALPPLADKIGSPVARAQAFLKRLQKESSDLVRFGENIFETYPAGSLELVGLNRSGYKRQTTTFNEGRWRGETLAKIANGLNLKAHEEVSLNDDDIDAIICSIAGVADSANILECNELQKEIEKRIHDSLPASATKVDCKPPKGYRLLKELGNFEINVNKASWQT
jgi:hypothetical protein